MLPPEPPPCITTPVTSHPRGCAHVAPGVYAYAYDADGTLTTIVRVICALPASVPQRFIVRRIGTERFRQMPLEQLRVSADQDFGTPA
jgi:hypothetical protein